MQASIELIGWRRVVPGESGRSARARTLLGLVADDIAHGKCERGAIRFVEEVALGPGAWFALPEQKRRAIVASATTFPDLVAALPHTLYTDELVDTITSFVSGVDDAALCAS